MWQATDTMDVQNYLIKDLEKFFQLPAKIHNTSVKQGTYHLQYKDDWLHVEQMDKGGTRASCRQKEAEAKK